MRDIEKRLRRIEQRAGDSSNDRDARELAREVVVEEWRRGVHGPTMNWDAIARQGEALVSIIASMTAEEVAVALGEADDARG